MIDWFQHVFTVGGQRVRPVVGQWPNMVSAEYCGRVDQPDGHYAEHWWQEDGTPVDGAPSVTNAKPGKVTTTSAALTELVQTMRAIDRLYDTARSRELTEAEDQRLSQLENRCSGLEAQLQREVRDKLGVDYGVLWHAVTPSGPSR